MGRKNILKEFSEGLTITKKNIFLLGKTSETFYENMKKCLDEYHDYETDGLIFTPIKSPYLCEGQNMKEHERSLVFYPDVCKYKPLERLSIDFYVDRNGKLSVFSPQKKRNILFELKDFNYEKNISYERNMKLKEEVKNKIYEFQFYKKEGDTIYLEPTRERKDKFYPNKLEVAIDVWEIMKNPIYETTLRGEDIRLLRQYHNDIKRGIFDQNEKENLGLEYTKEDYLVDIGGGNGGDIDKWKKTNISF